MEMGDTQIELTKILSEIDKHAKALQHLEEKILKREAYASKRLAALYMPCWLGELPVLAAADSSIEETIASLKETTSEYLGEFNRKEADFSKFKGLLNLPVKGKIIHFYGPFRNKRLNNVVNFRTGIMIQAEREEPIRSVGNGITTYADWFRSYGNIITIDHGNHYYTVYAYLEELFKSKGDRVETDEVIATVGDTSINGRHRPSL